ncbi:MAG: xylulokinase [Christensenellales bacterium]|jgi:sugar (pentulose or hexulose) kinase
MNRDELRALIEGGEAYLGIELGSTRIKAVLIGNDHAPIASGGYEWENRLTDGIWTYDMDDVWAGLRGCYASLLADVREKTGARLTRLRAMGISGMMHGYLPFDRAGRQLAAFRTWRNTISGEAAGKLTEAFGYNIPQRWSVAHLYQAMLNGEVHVDQIAHLTTLAGHVHDKLTGERAMGVGEASGMFPIDAEICDYDARMLDTFDGISRGMGYPWSLRDLLPRVLPAGAHAGNLTPEGALLLDPSGALEPGCPMCPPEGDAGTGMVATNAVAPRAGNVSAGTSIFAMIVLERALSRVYPEIDIVSTPAGAPVAMVHCNNCTSDINAWVSVFGEFARMMGIDPSADELYSALYRKALEGDADCGGLVNYNFFSGEHILDLEEGRPLLMRAPDSRFTLANFMRAQLFSALGTLKSGMNILAGEHVAIDRIYGHGGFFKTKGVGQRMLAAAINTPVSVMETAGEGGAWGIAVLAAYMDARANGQSLGDYLDARVFANMASASMSPDPADVQGFDQFHRRFERGLGVERAAIDALRG